jgi:hypothetical protein
VMPQSTIHDRCATMPTVIGRKRGGSVTPAPCITCEPSEANGPAQSLWRIPNPIIAPEVAAAATSPARTPARIREEITREKKRRDRVHSREFTSQVAGANSGTREKTAGVVVIRPYQFDNCDQ